MGFLEYIPAEKLRATYNTESQILTLYAEGKVLQFTGGIDFSQQIVPGLFKFDLQGWVGPLTGRTVEYKREKEFNIAIPAPIKSVIIVDANNYPDGQHVPIHYEPSSAVDGPKHTAAKLSSENKIEQVEPSSVTPEKEHLIELLNTPFPIKESKKTASSSGSISTKFDDSYLKLTNAAIKGDNIVWTFDPIKVGTTQVVVVEYGGIPFYVSMKTYDIEIRDV